MVLSTGSPDARSSPGLVWRKAWPDDDESLEDYVAFDGLRIVGRVLDDNAINEPSGWSIFWFGHPSETARAPTFKDAMSLFAERYGRNPVAGFRR